MWIYSCATILRQTTTNTATVVAYANGLQATSSDTITISVATSAGAASSPNLPNEGPNPGLPDNGTNPDMLNITLVIWATMGAILALFVLIFMLMRRKNK